MKLLNKQELIDLAQELTQADDISLNDLPDINLYMEQLTSFFEGKLADYKRSQEDKILTKTMINNYTKAGLLMPPENKKYGKRHMMLLILIYQLKSVVSISDIHALFKPILNKIETPDDDVISLDDIYSTFLEVKKFELGEFCESFTHKLDLIEKKATSIDESNKGTAELFLLVVMLIAQANAQKRIAEKIIDRYFKA